MWLQDVVRAQAHPSERPECGTDEGSKQKAGQNGRWEQQPLPVDVDQQTKRAISVFDCVHLSNPNLMSENTLWVDLGKIRAQTLI